MRKLNKKGFSFVEALVVTLILALVIGGGFMIFTTGQATWFATGINIRLQENLRLSLQRISAELRHTRIAQQQILDGAGLGGSDVIRFSIPVICEAGGNLLDENGDVAHWGAPFRWGGTDSTDMDADDDCMTVDYKFVEYRLNNNNQLVRRVLDGGSAYVANSEREFANSISDFQIRINGGVITLQISAQETAENNRVLTASATMDVYLRN